MGFKEKLFNGKIKIYPVEDVYRIYGKTFEDKDEIKQLGGVWNSERKVFEISREAFAKLEPEVRNKILHLILQEKVKSKKVIEENILNDNLKLYLKDNVYRVYGKTKEIYKDLINTGFHFVDGKYEISIETFSAGFCDGAKEKVMQLVNEPPQVEDEEMEA